MVLGKTRRVGNGLAFLISICFDHRQRARIKGHCYYRQLFEIAYFFGLQKLSPVLLLWISSLFVNLLSLCLAERRNKPKISIFLESSNHGLGLLFPLPLTESQLSFCGILSKNFSCYCHKFNVLYVGDWVFLHRGFLRVQLCFSLTHCHW